MSLQGLRTLQADGPYTQIASAHPEQGFLPSRNKGTTFRCVQAPELCHHLLPLTFCILYRARSDVVSVWCGPALHRHQEISSWVSQISHSCQNNHCLFLNIHICILLICLLVLKPRGRVMFPNISVYLGLEMCTAPFKKISVPPLVVQVQLWLQEKCHCKAHSLWNAEELSLEKFSMVFYLHLPPPCSQTGWRDTVGWSFPSTFSSAPIRRRIRVWPAAVEALTSTISIDWSLFVGGCNEIAFFSVHPSGRMTPGAGPARALHAQTKVLPGRVSC